MYFFVNISNGFSQNSDINKFRTSQFAYKYEMPNNNWSDWSDWEDTSILVVFDLLNERIKIFSNETQVYDIATDEGKTIDDAEEETYSWFCVNEDGIQCRVKLMKRFYEDGDFYNQLYINFKDVQYVYNIYKIG